MDSLPDYSKIKFEHEPGQDLNEILEDAPEYSVELISNLLQYDSNARMSAIDCLAHPFFFSQPLPADVDQEWDENKISIQNKRTAITSRL